MTVTFTNKIHSIHQDPPNPGFRSVRVRTNIFSKRKKNLKISKIKKIENSFFGFLASLESKIKKGSFF